MHLVLADTCDAKWSYPSPEYLEVEVSKEELLSTTQYERLNNDEIGKQALELLTKSYGALKILLPVNDCMSDWAAAIVSGNLVRRLSEQFGTAVKISVVIKCTNIRQTHRIAEVEGTETRYNSFMCVGWLNSTGVDNIKRWNYPTVYVNLVADVPDDYAIKKRKLCEDMIPTSKRVLEEASFSDVTIVAGNGTEFQAHKCFLSVCSPVFKKMFETEMKESETGKLEMTDVTEEGVQALLRYVYYGDLKGPKEDIELALELLRASHMYEMCNLETEMLRSLLLQRSGNFSTEQAFNIYMLARNIDSIIELKNKALGILKGKLAELESLQEYKDLFEKPSNSKIAMELTSDLAKAT